MREIISKTLLGITFITGGIFINKALTTHHEGQAQGKPVILQSCSVSGCHQPAPSELRGNLISVSLKGELLQINTGVPWDIKFDENTKVVGWNQPLNKLSKDAPIKVVYTKRGEELYATLISVKPPVTVPADKLVKVEEMRKIWEEKKAVIVDARPPMKYFEGHIPGAINVPFTEMDKYLDKLPQDKNTLIVTYCEGPR